VSRDSTPHFSKRRVSLSSYRRMCSLPSEKCAEDPLNAEVPEMTLPRHLAPLARMRRPPPSFSHHAGRFPSPEVPAPSPQVFCSSYLSPPVRPQQRPHVPKPHLFHARAKKNRRAELLSFPLAHVLVKARLPTHCAAQVLAREVVLGIEFRPLCLAFTKFFSRISFEGAAVLTARFS